MLQVMNFLIRLFTVLVCDCILKYLIEVSVLCTPGLFGWQTGGRIILALQGHGVVYRHAHVTAHV